MKIKICIIAFTIYEEQLWVFLKPNNDGYSIPEADLHDTSSLDNQAQVLVDSLLPFVGIDDYREQLYTTVSEKEKVFRVAYVQLVAKSDVLDFNQWFSLGRLPNLNTEISSLISYARLRLRWKLEYTNVAYSLLPLEFTLSELQGVYEIILGHELDKRNFRKKIHSLHVLVKTRTKKEGIGYRPAQLYRFKDRKPIIVEIL